MLYVMVSYEMLHINFDRPLSMPINSIYWNRPNGAGGAVTQAAN